MNRRVRLAELLPDVAGIPADLDITGLVQDSRAIEAGNAFVAIAGFGAHGLKFVVQAKQAGAAAILFEPPMPTEFDAAADAAVPLIAVPGLRARLGAMADTFHGAPSRTMTTVGVTGTNGKTSTVQLLAQAWTNCLTCSCASSLNRTTAFFPVRPPLACTLLMQNSMPPAVSKFHAAQIFRWTWSPFVRR